MPRARILPAALALVATSLTLAACGSEPDTAPTAKAPATTAGAAAADAGVTQARLGDATAADARTGTRLLARGRAVRPGDKRPGQPRREGVGAAVDCTGIDDQTVAATAAASNAAVLCLLNTVRSAAGVPPLVENALLDAAATAYARTMVADRFFSHTGADGSSVTDRIRKTGYLTGAWTVGENLALGGGSLSTPRAIVESWLNSEGHRANIMDPDFRDIGLGVAIGIPIGDGNGATFVNEFGANASSASDAAADADVAGTSAPAATAPTAAAATRTDRLRRRACARRKTAKARKSCRARVARAAAARRAAAQR